jgi:hypothetical protein
MTNLDYEIAMALEAGMDALTIGRLMGLTEEELEELFGEPEE